MIITLERQLLYRFGLTIQCRFHCGDVSLNSYEKALQFAVVSRRRWHIAEALIPLDANWEANNAG